MRTSFCSADCTNCIKVANERAVKETQNPFAEKSSLFSGPGVGFGGIIYSSSNTGTTTTNAHPKPDPDPNPNEGVFGDKSSVVFRESVPSNFLATSSWTHSSLFGPSTTTTPFDYSATPLHSFKFQFPPTSNDTIASDSVWKPTTQTLPGNGKTQVCNECGAAKASQNPDNEKSSSSPFGVHVSKSLFGIIDSNNITGTTTSTAQPNPNQGGLGFCSTQPNKSSSAVSDSGGFGPSNVFATNSWTHSSLFGPKTTTPFDYSATPINSFKFPPTSNYTTASVFKPTTQPQPHEVCGNKESGAYSGTVCPYESGNGIITSISAMPVYADKSHELLRFQHYQLQGKPTPAPAPTVDQFSKLTIFAQPQPQLTLPIFVLTMMGSSVGLTQIGTLPATPLTNGNGITISESLTFGPPTISGSPTFGSPATTPFGTGPPSSGSSPALLFGAPATTSLSFPQNAAYGDN